MENLSKWDRRFVDLACHVAGWSKDPSTQVGAVIAGTDSRIISLGFNGFPQGVSDRPEDYEDRVIKYLKVIHAEANAILFAQGRTKGAVLYLWPLPPCANCASLIIQSGVSRVVMPDEIPDRWAQSAQIASEMLNEAGVVITQYRWRL